MTKKRRDCYAGIFNKIDHIDERINEIKQQLARLKEGFVNNENGEEVCMDEVEAEKALLEIMNETALEALLDSNREGDA